MAKPKPKRNILAKYVTHVGTPNTLVRKEHETPAPAKGHVMAALRERKKWAEAYSHAVRDQVGSIIEQVDRLNLVEAKAGRKWEWTATDEVTRMTFVYKIEVLQ